MAYQLSGLKFEKHNIHYYYTNDSPNNPRSDGGYITLAVQVNNPVFDDEKSTGWVTIWHIKTTIPHKGDGKDPQLPQPQKDPIFVGELKMTFKNDPLIVNASITKKSHPYAAVHVPYIMLQYAYQGLRIAPILWLPVATTATGNLFSQINRWNEVRANLLTGVNPEPPLGLIVADMPDPTLRDYWDKVGFNFLAATYENVWSIDAQSKQDMMDVVTGKANAQTLARVAPDLQIAVGEVRGAIDYIEKLATEGIKRGNWTEMKNP
jgi:hypothetical protein